LEELVIYPKRSAPATAISLNDSEISAELTARIVSIPVRVGETVNQGQLLVRLNCEDYELMLTQSEALVDSALAQVTLAKKQLRRVQSLIDKNNISREDLNLRQTELESARAELVSRRAERDRNALNVSRCAIRSPFDGIVLERIASVGERADAGTALVRLLDASHLELSAQVPVQHIDTLVSSVDIWFQPRDERHPLALRVITPFVNTLSRNREVRLTFIDKPALPGTAGRLVWQDAEPHLPASLLLMRNGALGTFIANDRRAHFVPLATALEGQPARISLPMGSRIIVEGRYGLHDGDSIAVQ
jgi:RND family efflux transporter MFP subunit